ncbi:MAG: hypothetical protein E7108_04110 [Bacteroidales bacterium]|nr:hypothetical protein [Bacteroidales bacterium]
MKGTLPQLSIICACCLVLASCKSNTSKTENADYDTVLPDLELGKYPEKSVITGHILNRDHYPQTEEIVITMPFFDRVDCRYSARIDNCGNFKIILYPYAKREAAMLPFVERFIVSPGDSLHIELDFNNLQYVKFSGLGKENNDCYNSFLTAVNYDKWPSMEGEDAESFVIVMKKELASKLYALQDWKTRQNLTAEMDKWCQREILVSYYCHLVGKLLARKAVNSNESLRLENLLNLKEFEMLFDGETAPAGLFELARNIASLIQQSASSEEKKRISALMKESKVTEAVTYSVSHLGTYISNSFEKEMIVASLLHSFLEQNKPELFAQCSTIFWQNITHPLLKYSLAELYRQKKSYKDNPQLVTDYFLKSWSKDKIYVSSHPGAEMLRSIVKDNGGKVVYISIGASWCPPCIDEIKYTNTIVEKYSGKPLSVISLYLDKIEEKQARDLDAIFHLKTIPYYLLVNKEGYIADFGNHLKPYLNSTIQEIENLLEEAE